MHDQVGIVALTLWELSANGQSRDQIPTIIVFATFSLTVRATASNHSAHGQKSLV